MTYNRRPLNDNITIAFSIENEDSFLPNGTNRQLETVEFYVLLDTV